MINLLPTDSKEEIRAARTNLILVRYIIILVAAVAFIMGAMYATYAVLGFTKQNSEQIIESNDVKADVYSTTKAQVDTLSASLAQTKLLFDEEVKYSKVFVNIAQSMPAGTVFGKIALTDASFKGSPTTAKVYAKTSADAVMLRQNFQKSPMFTNVTFQSIVESGGGIEGYPVSVDMTFILTKELTR
jgi:Tfp pilus assembly protein PilN